MGSFLDKPVTDKTTDNGSGLLDGQRISFGVSEMQGWRVDMEDAHTHVLGVPGLPDLSFFGVYDGHGGSMVSKYTALHLLEVMRSTESWAQLTKSKMGLEQLEAAMHSGFLKLDAQMRALPAVQSQEDHSGSTAITAFLTPDSIVFGNCGDSRALLCRGGRVHFATSDHKPYVPSEQQRIEAAGGSVSLRRVNGDLAVSRALGDFMYKRRDDLPATEQQVSPDPEVTAVPRDKADQFLILACDGIWDVMENEEAAEFVLARMSEGYGLGEICEQLIDCCLEKNSRDNMSVVIVALPGAPKEIGTRPPDPPKAPE